MLRESYPIFPGCVPFRSRACAVAYNAVRKPRHNKIQIRVRMSQTVHAIPPGRSFWPQVARLLIARAGPSDLASRLVLVPTYAHIAQLRSALMAELGGSFVPPQIRTLDNWLEQQVPDVAAAAPSTPTERLMALYATLRETPWLKKLFAARRNTDLLPLAQTLISIADELTAALLPTALAQPADVEDRWQAALAQLSPRAAALLSDEAQLVWKLWHVERDARDPGLARHAALQRAAAAADCPLFWCSPWSPDALETAFLDAWAMRQPVDRVGIAWFASALPAIYAVSWPELLDDADGTSEAPTLPAGLRLFEAGSMEQQAQGAAQIIVDWLQAGRQRIALIPQDRVVARRLRALLERAQVVVADETGWKLSTTRVAAVLNAWMALASSGGDVPQLLDFLKSPYLRHDALDDAAQRGALEAALIGVGPAAGWDSIVRSLAALPNAKGLIDAIAREAERYRAGRTVDAWVESTLAVFDALGCAQAIGEDKAGAQMIAMLEQLARDCESLGQKFSLAEWRVLVDLQMEQTVFVAPRDDVRVMMVPLNGSTLREFDAAIVVGADAEHLPSRPAEALFFANAVRRELGLETRESRQRQQLREFASLLVGCPDVVLCWQAQRDGQEVAPSPWIQRLELTLATKGCDELPRHRPQLASETLVAAPQDRPAPAAPQLLPASLSASGYNTLVACPYQFFASRMLALSAADEINELPERRDFGDWIHRLLERYHDTVRDEATPADRRHALMAQLTDEVFDEIIAGNPAALGYKARWMSRRDAYVDWANALEAEGWRFAFGEEPQAQTLDWDGGSVRLVGKVDRVDRNAAGELMVLDYKSTRIKSLADRIRQREDHQLPFYALLVEPAPVRAAYVPFDDSKLELVETDELDDWRDALREQLRNSVQAIATGAPLAATGTGKSCQYCQMRGLCRKGAW